MLIRFLYLCFTMYCRKVLLVLNYLSLPILSQNDLDHESIETLLGHLLVARLYSWNPICLYLFHQSRLSFIHSLYDQLALLQSFFLSMPSLVHSSYWGTWFWLLYWKLWISCNSLSKYKLQSSYHITVLSLSTFLLESNEPTLWVYLSCILYAAPPMLSSSLFIFWTLFLKGIDDILTFYTYAWSTTQSPLLILGELQFF